MINDYYIMTLCFSFDVFTVVSSVQLNIKRVWLTNRRQNKFLNLEVIERICQPRINTSKRKDESTPIVFESIILSAESLSNMKLCDDYKEVLVLAEFKIGARHQTFLRISPLNWHCYIKQRG